MGKRIKWIKCGWREIIKDGVNKRKKGEVWLLKVKPVVFLPKTYH